MNEARMMWILLCNKSRQRLVWFVGFVSGGYVVLCLLSLCVILTTSVCGVLWGLFRDGMWGRGNLCVILHYVCISKYINIKARIKVVLLDPTVSVQDCCD